VAGSKPGHDDEAVSRPAPQKEKSRLAAGLSCFRSSSFELVTALALLILALLIGLLALAVRILLLLSGFLAAALLAGLLARVLVLLTRVLILVGHRDLPG
jgi:hypothetical protein